MARDDDDKEVSSGNKTTFQRHVPKGSATIPTRSLSLLRNLTFGAADRITILGPTCGSNLHASHSDTVSSL